LHVVNIARFLKGLLVEFEVCPKGRPNSRSIGSRPRDDGKTGTSGDGVSAAN